MSNMEKIVTLAKHRGFVFANSDIYGGLANAWDYGPLGVELKNNIRDLWWKYFVKQRFDIVGLDAGILMNSKVWEASGHVGSFSDPLIDCKECKERFRADKLIADFSLQNTGKETIADGWSNEQTKDYLTDNKVKCPQCGANNWTDVRQFNLMFETHQGVTKNSSSQIYLRPETAQGIFVDFKSIVQSTRKKVPFGVAQIGKAFRNEISPGNFIFRTREFEQMEIEYFVEPGTEKEWHQKWEKDMYDFLYNTLNINNKDNFRLRWHNENELSHYSSGTFDIEYQFPFGWSELWGCASRTDYDLKQHEKFSKQDMTYFSAEKNSKYHPFVIEPTFGLTRTLLMILCDAYSEETLDNGENRVVLKFYPKLAPFKVAVFPLVKKLSKEAQKIAEILTPHFTVDFDEAGSIGKRYRRHDEIGTPFTITVDFDTTGTGNKVDPKLKNTVTIRDRDTMKQQRIPVDNLIKFFTDNL